MKYQIVFQFKQELGAGAVCFGSLDPELLEEEKQQPELEPL